MLERTEFNESLHHWHSIHKVKLSPRYLYVYVSDSMAHVIPRRSFLSEGEMHEFMGELERRRG